MTDSLTSILGDFSAPANHRELLISYQRLYDRALADRKYLPFVYPYHFFGIYALYAYLLIPHRNYGVLYYLRFPLFVGITAFEIHTLKTTARMTIQTRRYSRMELLRPNLLNQGGNTTGKVTHIILYVTEASGSGAS